MALKPFIPLIYLAIGVVFGAIVRPPDLRGRVYAVFLWPVVLLVLLIVLIAVFFVEREH